MGDENEQGEGVGGSDAGGTSAPAAAPAFTDDQIQAIATLVGPAFQQINQNLSTMQERLAAFGGDPVKAAASGASGGEAGEPSPEFMEFYKSPAKWFEDQLGELLPQAVRTAIGAPMESMIRTTHGSIIDGERERIDGIYGPGTFNDVLVGKVLKDTFKNAPPERLADEGWIRMIVDSAIGQAEVRDEMHTRYNAHKDAMSRTPVLPGTGLGAARRGDEVPAIRADQKAALAELGVDVDRVGDLERVRAKRAAEGGDRGFTIQDWADIQAKAKSKGAVGAGGAAR